MVEILPYQNKLPCHQSCGMWFPLWNLEEFSSKGFNFNSSYKLYCKAFDNNSVCRNMFVWIKLLSIPLQLIGNLLMSLLRLLYRMYLSLLGGRFMVCNWVTSPHFILERIWEPKLFWILIVIARFQCVYKLKCSKYIGLDFYLILTQLICIHTWLSDVHLNNQ